jgi:hypothetical protein
MMLATGYFGIPGSSRGNFTVHAVGPMPRRRPLCGWRPSKEHKFQWCAHGIKTEYLECGHCKRIARSGLLKRLGLTN